MSHKFENLMPVQRTASLMSLALKRLLVVGMIVGGGVTTLTALRAQPTSKPVGTPLNDPRVRLVSVQVTAKANEADDKGIGAVFSRPSGVTLTFFVLTERKVLGIDWDACRMFEFVDESRTDLSKTWGPFKLPWLVPNPSNDRERPFTFTVQSKLLPAAGSRFLKLDAEIAFLLGSELRTETHEDVTFALNTVLTLANVPCSISKIAKRNWDGQEEVTFKTPRPLHIIEQFECYDAAGNAIPTKEAVGAQMEQEDYVRTWAVPKAANVKRIKLRYHSKTEVVPVRIQREIGAGL